MFFSGIWFEHHYLVWNITCENDRKKYNVMIKECVPGHCFYVISGFTITAWPRNVYLKLFNWFSIKYIECETSGKNKYYVHCKGLLRTTISTWNQNFEISWDVKYVQNSRTVFEYKPQFHSMQKKSLHHKSKGSEGYFARNFFCQLFTLFHCFCFVWFYNDGLQHIVQSKSVIRYQNYNEPYHTYMYKLYTKCKIIFRKNQNIA